MKTTVLIENTTDHSNLYCEHGLSLYIETLNHNILFDTGQSDKFIHNANQLNIDLTTVDIAILSHGHYDHCGGLNAFLELNHHAKVYIQETAFDGLFSDKGNNRIVPIGIDQELKNHPQVITLNGDYVIDDELELLANIKISHPLPSMNQTLKTKLIVNGNESYVNDVFSHEHNLIIREKDSTTLIAGCAHKGIMNILDSYKQRFKTYPDLLFSGFHLSSDRSGFIESQETLQAINDYLQSANCTYYTGHCTGLKPFTFFKDNLGDRINYMSTGSSIEVVTE